ncbi:MAG: hypothetical protein ACIAQF_06550 [Phycisphaerales bacterium JB065]
MTDASQWALSERIVFVDAALVVSSNPSDTRIPQPIIEGLIIPTLEEWMSESPQTSAPHRWLGLVTHDVRSLETALALDSQDQIACEALIRFVIESVQYAVHELPSGYLGDLEKDWDALQQALSQTSALSDELQRQHFATEINSLIELVESYREYASSDAAESFSEWTQSNSRAVRYPPTYDDQSGPTG